MHSSYFNIKSDMLEIAVLIIFKSTPRPGLKLLTAVYLTCQGSSRNLCSVLTPTTRTKLTNKPNNTIILLLL